MKSSRALVFLVALLTVPALAGAGVITNGIDTWTTPGDGSSFIDFGDDPIPAGFFCVDSEPFSGRITWRGVPLVSKPAAALGEADTIVQRLDNVVFDREGHATTRLQVRALSLGSLEPIHTRCGSFEVFASLQGVQPVTSMQLFEQEPGSGYFEAMLAMNVKLTFNPIRGVTLRPVVLERVVELRTAGAPWSSEPPENLVGQVGGFVLVDTDGDRNADTFLPGQSAFHPRGGDTPHQIEKCMGPIGAICHVDPTTGKCHCAYP